MTQLQIEALDDEEFSHLLAFGEPSSSPRPLCYTDLSTNLSMGIDDECLTLDWIGTLDSMTYPGSTFGYHVLMGT